MSRAPAAARLQRTHGCQHSAQPHFSRSAGAQHRGHYPTASAAAGLCRHTAMRAQCRGDSVSKVRRPSPRAERRAQQSSQLGQWAPQRLPGPGQEVATHTAGGKPPPGRGSANSLLP